MADDYLGRKMEEYEARSTTPHRHLTSLHTLLLRSSNSKGFDNSFIVRDDQLQRIIDSASKMFDNSLLFHPVTPCSAISSVRKAHPTCAFIAICSDSTDKRTLINIGITAETMLLQAAEIGLCGELIDTFDAKTLRNELQLSAEPQLLVAIGKSK